MITIILGLCIILAGAIAMYIIIRPSLHQPFRNKPLIIPLEEISIIWTRHNKEVMPQPKSEVDKIENVMDTLWNPTTGSAAETSRPPVVSTLQPIQSQTVQIGSAGSNANGCQLSKDLYLPERQNTEAVLSGSQVIPVPQQEVSTIVKQQDPAPVKLSLADLHESLVSVWSECIAPYKKLIKIQGLEEIIMTLLKLLEKHGNCPSIVVDNRDDESLDLLMVRDKLLSITLQEHSYTVCRKLVSIIKKDMPNADYMIPTAVIIALGHDIGKIPEYRLSRIYNSCDHAYVSSDKLAELLLGRTEFFVKKCIDAVRLHHSATKDYLTCLLQQAERQSRQMELVSFDPTYQTMPFEKWFNVKKYINDYIAPLVNIDRKGKWNAFSFNGTIYAKPDWLYEMAGQMCRKENILDMYFVYITEKDAAIRMIVNAMRKENLTPLLGEKYYARKFDIRTSQGGKKPLVLYMTAFNIPLSINTVDIESKKTGFTKIIDRVKPLT